MHRLVALLVVLAHLGVASMPCFEASSGPEPMLVLQTLDPHRTAPQPDPTSRDQGHHDHHGHAAMVASPAARHGDHAHHAEVAASESHAHHGRAAAVNPHAGHDHGDHSGGASVSEPGPDVARGEMRAPCPCGCSKRSDSMGTTTSPRLGFALFPPAPVRWGVAVAVVDAPTSDRLPVPVSDPPDLVPILS